MNRFRDTLVMLVTCSRDATRRDLAVTVTKNVAELIPAAELQESFMIFDNASKFTDHLKFAPKGATIIQSPENVGYWTAIKWALEHHKELFGRTFKYLYLIESDLTHSDLRPLRACEDFLATTPEAGCVRTQEFSVRFRWRFSKALHYMPFHVTRSEILLNNAVTGEHAWFRRCTGFPGFYLTNLHAKLPALNRVEALEKVFAALALKDGFSEQDFFVEMHKLYPLIGVYDGGIFHSLNSRKTKDVMSGSFSSVEALARMGYHQTRYARIVFPPQNMKVSKVPA